MATLSKSPLPAGRRIRVLIVDDSVVVRRILSAAIEGDPGLELVGSAGNGVVALQRLEQLNPDVITLDIEMPEMDGIETLRRIRATRPHLPVIMCSTLTERGAAITIDALLAGASDYVTKDLRAGYTSDPQEGFRLELLVKIKQFFTVIPPRAQPGVADALSRTSLVAATHRPLALRPLPGPREVLAIGVSTGGPNALTDILPTIPAGFPLPILIVQHMPPIFTKLFAARLDSLCKIHVEEAVDGRRLEPGLALIAPGDYHMALKRVDGSVTVVLNQNPRENSCRPSVDVTFRAVHEMYRGAVIAVILTGMGQDGLRGVEILKPAGASVLVQDEASSVVWGMPGFVARAGLADRVLPLQGIVPAILAMQDLRKTGAR